MALKNKVTVVIPCYNQAEYLKECLDSLSAQTTNRFSIIVVDDGSTDNPTEVCTQWSYDNQNIHIEVLQQENKGLSEARNAGFELAQTEWVLPLDADDKIDPTYIEKVLDAAKANPEVSIVSTDALFFGIGEGFWKTKPILISRLKYNNTLTCCSLVKKEIWERVGGYKSNMIYGYEDWEFWINCAKHGASSHTVQEFLFHYRNKTFSMIKSAKKFDTFLRAMIVYNNPEVYTEDEIKFAHYFKEMHDAVILRKNPAEYYFIRQQIKGRPIPVDLFGRNFEWKSLLQLLEHKINTQLLR